MNEITGEEVVFNPGSASMPFSKRGTIKYIGSDGSAFIDGGNGHPGLFRREEGQYQML